MNLMKFKGADDAVKLTIRLSAGYCIILTIAFASSIIFLINKIEKAYGQALVIDRQGEVYEASSLSASDMRQYEYMNHVKTFVTHWYAFDESSYEKNISLALNQPWLLSMSVKAPMEPRKMPITFFPVTGSFR